MDLADLDNNSIAPAEPVLLEAKVKDNASGVGDEVRCIIAGFDPHQATDPMPWMAYEDSRGIFYPKVGDRAMLAFPDEGPPVIAWWKPKAEKPDVAVVKSATDFGIVEALPGGTVAKGSLCTCKAATGVYWHLVYTGEETYPWAKIGGPPIFAEYTAAENVTTTSTTPQTTNAPSVTTPALKMEADVEWGAHATFASAASTQPRMKLFVGASEVTPTANNWASGSEAASAAVGAIRGQRRLTLASAVAVEARYYNGGGAGTVNFYTPFVRVDPLRVG